MIWRKDFFASNQKNFHSRFTLRRIKRSEAMYNRTLAASWEMMQAGSRVRKKLHVIVSEVSSALLIKNCMLGSRITTEERVWFTR